MTKDEKRLLEIEQILASNKALYAEKDALCQKLFNKGKTTIKTPLGTLTIKDNFASGLAIAFASQWKLTLKKAV